jgi:hypothetical protein
MSRSNQTYMVRHLERVDTEGKTPDECRQWNTVIKKKYPDVLNPYLITEPTISKLEDNLQKLAIDIDHIICSPYLRCIQTAIHITKLETVTVKDKTIHIDYRLGEFFSEFMDPPFLKPLDLDEIYKNSREYLQTIFTTLPELEVEPYKLAFESDESDEEYNKRINDAIHDIRKKYSGNILIVTHSDAYIPYNSAHRRMEYNKVYDITDKILDSYEGSHKQKYLKYKNKYLELKKLVNSKKI